VLNATAGWCSTIGEIAGVKLPITTFPLQACVTEPLEPFLDVVIFREVCMSM
jgi:sarcosine oxidase subunit beta